MWYKCVVVKLFSTDTLYQMSHYFFWPEIYKKKVVSSAVKSFLTDSETVAEKEKRFPSIEVQQNSEL